MGVISAAHEVWLDVQGDLSAVGCDDIEMTDYVGLTTIRERLFESGRLGAETLLKEFTNAPVAAPTSGACRYRRLDLAAVTPLRTPSAGGTERTGPGDLASASHGRNRTPDSRSSTARFVTRG